MAFYLEEHPNPFGDAFYRSRRGTVLAYVLHITAGLEDLDGVDDLSAEKTAAYAASTERRVSWHVGSDADSVVELLPALFTAFHVTGYNSRTYGHEISKRGTDWRDPLIRTWTEATLRQAARHAARTARDLGIPIRKATKAELDREIAKGPAGRPVGFIGHGELDPARRSDPGFVGRARLDTFPWARFLSLVALYARPTSAPPPPAWTVDYPEANLKTTFLEIGPANGLGLARAEWDPELGREPIPVSVLLHGPDPVAGDGWWAGNIDTRAPRAQERGGKIVVTLAGLKPGTSTFAFVTVA